VFEETEPEQGGLSLNVAACYPELADGLPSFLCSLDVDIARQSVDWYDVVDALTDVAIERTRQPLGSLVPSLGAWAALDIGDDATLKCLAISPLSARSRNILQRNHLKTWGEVGTLSPGTIGGFVNAGVKVVRDVTRLVIELGAAAEVGLTEWHRTIVSSDGIPTQVVEQEVLRRRVYTTSPVTLDTIGTDLGVTHERVRQIQVRAENRIERLFTASRFAPVHWAAFTLHSALGSLAPAEAAARELGRLSAGVAPDDVIVASTILLHLAGPYRIERTAYVTEDVREIHAGLSAVADPYGVIAVEDVHSVLATCGVLPGFFDSALAWLDGFRRFGDVLVVWPNNGVDKLVAMLALRGQPADTETLVRECGEDYSARALHNRLGEDPRVVRVGRREWGLVEWGLEEYSGIAEEIAERIERGGGRACLADVVAEVARFGVRESSVRIYAEAPMFVIEGEWIRLRGEDERARADDGVGEARRTYRLGPTTIAYLVEVDYDTLRGSGKAIPRGTSVALGVQPGAKVRFDGDDGDIVVSWLLTSITGPSIGSLRSHAFAHGLSEGDHLRIVFDTGTTRVTSIGIRRGELSTLDTTHRAAALTGIEGLAGPNVASVLAVAIEAPIGTLRRALIGRGDEALLELLPADSGSPELDEALASLARALTESH
jgi:hypothetical protein